LSEADASCQHCLHSQKAAHQKNYPQEDWKDNSSMHVWNGRGQALNYHQQQQQQQQ